MRFTTLFHVLAALALTAPAGAQAPTLVRDFFPGSSGAFVNHGRPYGFRVHDGKLLLFANDGLSLGKLFQLDDLSGNVQELAHVGGALGYTTTNGGLITSGDNIYFFAQQEGSVNDILWRVSNGSVQALDTIPYQVLFYFTGIPLPGGRLIYPGSDPDHGYEPWITDGTPGGTHRLKDITPGTATSLGTPFPLFQGFDFGGKAYFLASDGTNGPQLWCSDGTEAGTSQFAVINEAGAAGAVALRYSKNDERFIVGGLAGVIGSDGTPANTGVIHAAQYGFPHMAGLTYPEADGDDWMYFSALEDQWKLYRTRGTEATTELVVAGIPNLGYTNLTALNGKLYTLTADNEHVFLVGIDPAAQASAIVKTFDPDPLSGPNAGAFYGFRNDGQRFYFMGKEGSHARQYWQSDGTLDGTRMVHEFMPSVLNGGPDAADGNMIIFQGAFVFAANDADVGLELWAGSGVAGIAAVGSTDARVDVRCSGDGYLQVQSLEGAIRSVRVMDATGRTVLQQGGTDNDRMRIAAQQPTGIYLVQVTTTTGTATVRVFIP